MSWIWCIHPYIFDNLFNHIPFWNTTCPRSSMGISYVNMQLRCSQRWLIPCNEKSSSMILYRFIIGLSCFYLQLVSFSSTIIHIFVSFSPDQSLAQPATTWKRWGCPSWRTRPCSWWNSGGRCRGELMCFFPNLNYSDYICNRYIYIYNLSLYIYYIRRYILTIVDMILTSCSYQFLLFWQLNEWNSTIPETNGW